MPYDRDKVDNAVLALLHLTARKDGPVTRAWKAHDWDVLDRLFEKGYIADPRSKARSVVLTEEGREKSGELFRQYFASVESDGVVAARPKGRDGSRPHREQGHVYRLKIALTEIRPPIWRRILVPDVMLAELHVILQAAMGWQGCHLYRFDVAGVTYTDQESAAELSKQVAGRTRLGALGLTEGYQFSYTYDFGDDWRHEIIVEAVLPPGQEKPPVCLEGKRACPPENVGGASGYKALLSALRNPRHTRHAALRAWAGPFNPEAFDVDLVNESLQRLRADRSRR
jgi:hypothetical protein